MNWKVKLVFWILLLGFMFAIGVALEYLGAMLTNRV